MTLEEWLATFPENQRDAINDAVDKIFAAGFGHSRIDVLEAIRQVAERDREGRPASRPRRYPIALRPEDDLRLRLDCDEETLRLLTCHAARDGDCFWSDCPQIRDKEPETSSRHCPLDILDPDQ